MGFLRDREDETAKGERLRLLIPLIHSGPDHISCFVHRPYHRAFVHTNILQNKRQCKHTLSLCWGFLVHKFVMFCLCKFPVLSLKYTEVPQQKAGGCRAERCSEGGKRRWMDRRSIGVRDGRHSGSVREPQTKQKR